MTAAVVALRIQVLNGKRTEDGAGMQNIAVYNASFSSKPRKLYLFIATSGCNSACNPGASAEKANDRKNDFLKNV